MCGCTLFGLECYKLEQLIDYLETRNDIDAARLGMAGLGLGGAATLMCTPLIERVKAACAACLVQSSHPKDGARRLTLPLLSRYR